MIFRFINGLPGSATMLRISLLWALSLHGVGLSAQIDTNNISIRQVSGPLYAYTTYGKSDGQPYPSNSMYLVTKEGTVLFDTPWNEGCLQRLLDSISNKHNSKAIICISTHFHEDRTLGIDYYNKVGVHTYTSKLTDSLSAIHHMNRARFHFNGDTTFTIGDQKIEVYYPGEGHTKDNLVIWFPAQKVLYGGCFIKSNEAPGLGNIADANLTEWPAALARVRKKFPSPEFVVPGHLGWTTNEALAATVKLLSAH